LHFLGLRRSYYQPERLLDMDNVVGMVKPVVDTMRKQKVIDDDNRKHWDALHVFYDPELPKNTVRFVMTGEKA